jgi:hypothetical protein
MAPSNSQSNPGLEKGIQSHNILPHWRLTYIKDVQSEVYKSTHEKLFRKVPNGKGTAKKKNVINLS